MMKHMHRTSFALISILVTAGLILLLADVYSDLLAAEVKIDPLPDELAAMKKAEANPSKANIEALSDIRYRHAIRLMQLSEKNKGKNSLELAVMYAESTTELSPNSAKYWALLGMLYERMKDNQLAQIMAVEALKKAVMLNPMDLGSRLLLGYLYFSDERYSLALEQYEEVVNIDSYMIQPSIIASMCIAYIVDFQHERGANFFKRVLSKHPDADTARLGLAILLKQKKNTNEAEMELQKIIKSSKASAFNRQYSKKLIQQWKKEVPE